jgi:uncharacterized phage-associated protein
MTDDIKFNRGKFKELVLFFAQEAARSGDERFGMVKLNKLLYHADFEAFRRFGAPITGESYERQEFGPVARDLPIVLDELGAAGRLEWQLIPRGEHVRKVPALRGEQGADPDMTQFSEKEIEQLRATLEALAIHGGKSASEWSHEESAGWNMARENGATIEYGSVFLSTKPITEKELRRARSFLEAEGLVPS